MCNMSNTQRLAELRRALEEAAEIHELQVPALLLLDDVCRALGIIGTDRRKVLGRKAEQWLEQWSHAPIGLTE